MQVCCFHCTRMVAFQISVVLLLLLSGAIEHSRCERFNIVPSPDSPCPGEFTGEPCITLQRYVTNPSLSSNITFEIHPGNHRLDSQLSASNINSFAMRANNSAIVTCSLNDPFYFYHLRQIHVSGITFVNCRMQLREIVNATFERNTFVNKTCCGAALDVGYSGSVLVRQCIISNNRVYGAAIYGYTTSFNIEQTTFKDNYYPNSCCNYGRAIYLRHGTMYIRNSNFSSNSATSPGHGGAIYTLNVILTIVRSCFLENRAGINGHGGAIYFDGSNITVTNSTFINNTASGGGGGAIYSVRRYTNISLTNSFFSQNIAAYCGVMAVTEFYHYVNITRNTFIHNRAIQHISGNNRGGAICIRNASVYAWDNNFSHNLAAGNAGVIQADESDIIIERSIFRNNTAGENGGVLYTYVYPTRYTIIDSTFTNNQAGGDGGAMYVGRAGSHVTMNQGTFSFNSAANRGGVAAIVGSTLEIDRATIFENTADSGDVISACNSNVRFNNNPVLLARQDPTNSLCFLYNNSNVTVSRTTEEMVSTMAIPTRTNTEQDHVLTATSASDDSITSTEQQMTTTAGNSVLSPTTDDESVPITPWPTTTKPVIVPPDGERDRSTPEYNLHYIVPGYVAIGVSAILIMISALLVIIKVFRIRACARPKLQQNGDNLHVLYDYPAT